MIDFLRNLFLHDVRLKLFSLGLAVLTWYTVLRISDPNRRSTDSFATARRTFSALPVYVISSAEDVRSVKVNPKEINVQVIGEPRIINALKPQEIRVLVDLTGIEAAYDLRKRVEITTPAGVTTLRADPEEVQVIFPARS